MSDFMELEVWERTRLLTGAVYAASAAFPAEERYGLTSQLRRAVNSIGANLAEGSGRPSRPDYRRFVGMSLGSVSEVEHHLVVARDLGYLAPAAYRRLRAESRTIRRMLSRQLASLR